MTNAKSMIYDMIKNNSAWPSKASAHDTVISNCNESSLMAITKAVFSIAVDMHAKSVIYHSQNAGDKTYDVIQNAYQQICSFYTTILVATKDMLKDINKFRCIRLFKQDESIGIISGYIDCYRSLNSTIIDAMEIIRICKYISNDDAAIKKIRLAVYCSDVSNASNASNASNMNFKIRSITEGCTKAKTNVYDSKTHSHICVASQKVVTVVFADNSIAMLKLGEGEQYDVHTAVAYAIAQKLYGSKTQFKKAVDDILAFNAAKAKKKIAAKAKRKAKAKHMQSKAKKTAAVKHVAKNGDTANA